MTLRDIESQLLFSKTFSDEALVQKVSDDCLFLIFELLSTIKLFQVMNLSRRCYNIAKLIIKQRESLVLSSVGFESQYLPDVVPGNEKETVDVKENTDTDAMMTSLLIMKKLRNLCALGFNALQLDKLVIQNAQQLEILRVTCSLPINDGVVYPKLMLLECGDFDWQAASVCPKLRTLIINGDDSIDGSLPMISMPDLENLYAGYDHVDVDDFVLMNASTLKTIHIHSDLIWFDNLIFAKLERLSCWGLTDLDDDENLGAEQEADESDDDSESEEEAVENNDDADVADDEADADIENAPNDVPHEPSFPCLTHVDLYDASVEMISMFTLTQLISFKLVASEVRQKTPEALSRLCDLTSQMINLQKLELSYIDLRPSRHAGHCLSNLIKHMYHLHEFTFRSKRQSSGDHANNMIRILSQNNPALRYLSLINIRMTDDALNSIANLQQLVHLTLRVDGITADAFLILLQGTLRERIKHLTIKRSPETVWNIVADEMIVIEQERNIVFERKHSRNFFKWRSAKTT